MKNKMLTQNEVLIKTGLKMYQLDYLIRLGEIPVIQYGKGMSRLFPSESVEKIRKILAKRETPK